MTDLRELLGDRYDDVIIKATKRALFNYPNLPIGIEQHKALAGQALHAVLPDLLAQAWEEGRRIGLTQADYEYGHRLTMPNLTNPYRQEG